LEKFLVEVRQNPAESEFAVSSAEVPSSTLNSGVTRFRPTNSTLPRAAARRIVSPVQGEMAGDGLMVAFPSAAEAVRCAIAMQQRARRPVAGERLSLRVGLHVARCARAVDIGDKTSRTSSKSESQNPSSVINRPFLKSAINN
jgi:hypothetical protein